MTTVLHPKGNRITVLRDPPKTKTEAGLELGNAVVDDHEIGTILEVGPFVRRIPEVTVIDPSGEMPSNTFYNVPEFSAGQRAIYSRFCGSDATIGGKNIRILTDEEIIGVLEGEGE